jgi:hypothetical protein
MVRYRETLTVEQISFLLDHDSLEIRRNFIGYQSLFIIEANDLLIDYYSTIENKKIKFLFKTFAVIGDNSTRDFLCNFLQEESP